MDGVNARSCLRLGLSPRPRDDQDVLVFRSVFVDVRNLFVNIALHPAAQRRIKLRQIANLQEIFKLRFAICDFCGKRDAVFLDDAIIATISPASPSNGLTSLWFSRPASMISSSQNALSSASSSTIPSFATNSTLERARHAAR